MRRRGLSLLSIAVLAASLFGGLGLPSAARGTVDLRICGAVSAYVPATAVAAGALTVGNVPLVIAAGATLSSQVAVGANLCFAFDLDSSGKISTATVTANVTATANVCGVVSAYGKADADSAGTLTIGGISYVIAVGAKLPASVVVGANLCLKLTLNGFGQITGGTATVNVTSKLDICGIVTAYAQADANSTGSLTIGGRTLTLAIGSSLPASVKVGADLCLKLTLNAIGQVQGGTATLNVKSTVQVCGIVNAYAKATSTTTGSMRIGGRTFILALGSQLPAMAKVGADLCLKLTLNAIGQVQGGTAQLNVNSVIEVCGQVTAFVAAGSTSNGSLTIAAIQRPIAAGAALSSQIKASAYLRLNLKLDVFGRVADAVVLKVGVSLADACRGAATPPTGPGSSALPNPSDEGDPSPSQSGEEGGPSPSQSSDEGTEPGNAGCVSDGTHGTVGRPADDPNGFLPDGASFGRAASLMAAMALPLLLLLLGLAGWILYQRRGSLVGENADEGEVAS